MSERREISIWFFCGILMLAYGLVLKAKHREELHVPL